MMVKSARKCEMCGVLTEGLSPAWRDEKEYLACEKCFYEIYPQIDNTYYDDAYWLRYFAAETYKVRLHDLLTTRESSVGQWNDAYRLACENAQCLLAEIKRVESEKK